MSQPAISPQIMLERARDYVRRGFSVIPLQVGGKKPLVAWTDYQTRRPTDDELLDWFAEENTFGLVGSPNVGIVTGSISGVDVIDCDSREAVDLATKHGIGTVPTVKTGRGFHFYFAHADGVRNFQKRDDLPGIDLRADGGYVVAPPSVHESGAVYRWEGENRSLAPLPRWIVSAPSSPGAKVQRIPVSRLFEGATEGNRNVSLTRVIGSIASSTPFDVALQLALLWGTHRCSPAMDPREIEITVRSVYSAEARKQREVDGAGWQPELSDPTGIVTIDDLREAIAELYRVGVQKGLGTGWRVIDDLYTVRKREMTVITGAPGSGKSTWMDHLAINLARLHGWKFLVFSAENLPHEEHVSGLLEKYLDMPFNEGPHPRMNAEQLDRGLGFLADHFFFIEPPEDRQDVRTLFAIASAFMETHPVDAIIFDPWNEIDHARKKELREDEYLADTLRIAKLFARKRDIHLFIVAHPTKLQRDRKTGAYPVPTLYDISGGAMWRNKTDNGIVVYRELSIGKDGDVVDHGVSNILVQKIRFRAVGRLGKAALYYDKVTARFDEKPRLPRGGGGWERE
jgi:energy-coupling factor transporter ATP-binding protein EcfA2